MKLKNKAKIEEWLEAGELAEVIDELKKQLRAGKTSKELYSDVLVLSAQLKKINADKMERLVSYEQESLALNNFRRNLMDFIEMVEQHEGNGDVDTAISTTKKEAIKQPIKSGIGWWWLLAPIAGIGIWLLFFNHKQETIINICTLNTMSQSGHCCNEDLPRISLNESHGVFYATASIQDDPVIQAALFLENGSLYPTEPVNFSYDVTNGDQCHSAMIMMKQGESWQIGRYTLKLLLNGEVAGQKTFEIIQ